MYKFIDPSSKYVIFNDSINLIRWPIMKTLERNRAIELRKQGRTYGEILKEISVSKGSLGYWLRDIKLTPEQIERIQYKNQLIKKKFIEYNELKRKKAEERRNNIKEAAKKEINKISQRELKLLGIALYWAEGSKCSRAGTVVFSNSDPFMIELMMLWFRKICCVPELKFRASFQAYNSQNIAEIREYWSKVTGIPLCQFIAPSLRTSKTSKGKRGNILPYGTLRIQIADSAFLAKILGWIDGLKGPMV